MKKLIASIYFLRTIFIPLLRLFNFRFKWKHDITKRNFHLEFFKHKGYWYYGKNREKFEIDAFYRLIQKGDKVLEVGTHIGYVTQVFEEIVGKSGQVVVIEPTPENYYFLKKNVYPTTKIICKAASNYCGESSFFTMNNGGFTNSLDREFLISVEEEIEMTQSFGGDQSQNISSQVKVIKVKVDTLDNICKDKDFFPTFLKIDVEGVELEVLQGATNILNSINALMVEITFHKKEIFQLLEKYGFQECYENSKSINYFFKK